ncbi:MAG: endonuclease/exonuclease/phosphatase family protein [Acidimicrobiales bacterium]
MAELTVATFNIHWGMDRRGRPYDLLAACRRLDADVLILQEVWRPDGTPGQVAELGRTLGYAVRELFLNRGVADPLPRVTCPRSPGAGGGRGAGDWGLTLLSRLPVLAEERIDLGQLPFDPARRGALRLDVGASGRRVAVIGTHLSHLTHGSLIQLGRLRRALPAATQPGLLGGDMNMWGPVVSAFLPGWRRSTRGRTWPAPHPHSQIDHLLVTGAIDVVGGEVLPPLGSDHRALRATLRLR